jgi:Flp pilus assembly protein TadD
MHPGAASILFERARIREALGDDAAAEAGYRAAIAANPRFFRAHNDLGLLYNRHGLRVDALQCFIAAIEADATNATGHANLGAMLLAGDDLAGARAAFERALALVADHPGARRGLTDVCARLGLPAPPAPAVLPAAPAPAANDADATDPYLAFVFDIAANAIVGGDDDAAFAFLEAIVPGDPRAVALLWRVADFAGSQRRFAIARRTFERALAIEPDHVEVRMGLAIVLEEMGESDAARALWRSDGLRGAVRLFPYRGAGEPVRVLTIASALHAIRYDLFVDATLMQNMVLATQAYDPAQPLPAHDVVLVAIADVESDAPALAIARAICDRTACPVLNHPDRVAHTSRTEVATRLSDIDGAVTAPAVAASRAALLARDAGAAVRERGCTFPLLVRSPGFHNGRYFELVADAAQLPAVLAALPADDVLLIAYRETRSPDGMVRKFRVMMIDGRLYPVHLAISPHWKVHYVTSAMAESEAFRAEEAAFLRDMPGVLGARVVATLEAIAAALQLDYGGIDFGLAPDGRVVVFEANGAMAIFLPDADPRWDYRRAAMTAAIRAATHMIVERARVPVA